MMGRVEIGRQFVTEVVRMSVLGISTTLAVFHSLGNVPVARDELKRFARLGAML